MNTRTETRDTPAPQPAPCAWATPAVDVHEQDYELRIVADIPGVGPGGVDLEVEDGVLHLRARRGAGERAPEGDLEYRRSFALGRGLDPAGVTAELSRGVLTVKVPRPASQRPLKVQITKA
jgi:HSP20 family protein